MTLLLPPAAVAPPGRAAPPLPAPRGPLTARLLGVLAGSSAGGVAGGPVGTAWPEPEGDPVRGEDAALALYVLYELHYRGFDGVDDSWEWDPGLLGLRRDLEARFLGELSGRLATSSAGGDLSEGSRAGLGASLDRVVGSETGPSLSAFMAERGTVAQFREFAVHRSAYQLKEADPHTWAIPRLAGRAKAALVEIQYDEYGRGEAARTHARLFARTMVALGLDPAYGAYLDRIPGVTLATVNLVSMLGLHRGMRGALVGHLAVFEMASVVPNGRYAAALRRLGFGPEATDFYEAHVEADRVHQVVARDAMAGALAEDEPALADGIVFGARALTALERDFRDHLLGSWARGVPSLRT